MLLDELRLAFDMTNIEIIFIIQNIIKKHDTPALGVSKLP